METVETKPLAGQTGVVRVFRGWRSIYEREIYESRNDAAACLKRKILFFEKKTRAYYVSIRRCLLIA